MYETPEPIIYQLKVVLLCISPMIWRRLLVCGESTITDLHYIIQISMGWSDDHLHQFRIHGKRYGVARIGGISFSDDPDTVRLKDLGFRINERFIYEYDFTDGWQLSLSEILSVATVTQPTDRIGAKNGSDESFA